MIDKKKNLEGHLKKCQDEVDRLTAMLTDQENIPFKTLIQINNDYANAANVCQFLASMINGLFPP